MQNIYRKEREESMVYISGILKVEIKSAKVGCADGTCLQFVETHTTFANSFLP